MLSVPAACRCPRSSQSSTPRLLSPQAAVLLWCASVGQMDVGYQPARLFASSSIRRPFGLTAACTPQMMLGSRLSRTVPRLHACLLPASLLPSPTSPAARQRLQAAQSPSQLTRAGPGCAATELCSRACTAPGASCCTAATPRARMRAAGGRGVGRFRGLLWMPRQGAPPGAGSYGCWCFTASASAGLLVPAQAAGQWPGSLPSASRPPCLPACLPVAGLPGCRAAA